MRRFIILVARLFGFVPIQSLSHSKPSDRPSTEVELESMIASLHLAINKMEGLPRVIRFTAEKFDQKDVLSPDFVRRVGADVANDLVKGHVLQLYGASQEFEELREQIDEQIARLHRFAIDNFAGAKRGVEARGNKLYDVDDLCRYLYHEPRLWHGQVIDEMLRNDNGYVN